MTTLPPLGLYVHFPWCVSKCPYCDFNSHTLTAELPETRYIDALLDDADMQAPLVEGRSADTVFLGGGTPSLFGPPALDRLLQGLRRRQLITPEAEVTLEANPATVERGRFGEYASIGINRVSLGAQSFRDETLKALGRIHTRSDTVRAAEELHSAGLTNFNLDLMFALPGHGVAEALSDVQEALVLQPSHVSHYQLTLEPGTVFAARPPPLPDDDSAWEMQVACQDRLATAGFEQYEVSAYARPGAQCRHNLNYWQFGDYLGVGAGAHGKLTKLSLTDPRPITSSVISRSQHLREPRRYLASAAGGPAWRAVPVSDLPFEFMMNALRLVAGFPLEQYSQRTGQSPDSAMHLLSQARHDGLLENHDGHWRATPHGFQFLNDVVQRFLPGEISPVVASS